MGFGVVFIEKNAEEKKTQCFWKSFTSYLHNGRTLEHNYNWFWKLQCRTATFIFSHFRKLVMWPPSQQPIGWTLTCIIIDILVSSTFWSSSMIFFFLDKYNEPWKQYLTSYTPLLFYIYVFFPFSGYFYCNKISIESTRHPYKKCNEIS